MKLRLFLSFLLALALCVTLCPSALADTAVADSYVLEARDVVLNPEANTLGVLKSDSDHYVVMSASGRELTNAKYIYMSERDGMYEVATEEGLHHLGVIDGQGNPLVPMQYSDIEYISPRWQLGVNLEASTVDNYDYKSSDAFYLISSIDVYFNGAKAGTLSRTEYSSAYAYGDYLYVRDMEGNYSYYDSQMNKSAYASDYSSEYEENYKDHSVWHKGSNQQAFVAGCTLTADEVDQSIWEINGQFFDLQGNLLFKAASPYDSVRSFTGDYALVKAYGKYGLIDKEGREVVPCEYDEISCQNAYLASGYQVAVKDGKVGYVNAEGKVTCDFVYSSANAKSTYRSPFTSLTDMEGRIIVLSGAIGELPERYSEVQFVYSDNCPVFAAKDAQGAAGIVDLSGNAVIPFDGTYDGIYDFTISDDGTLVVGYMGNRQYTVYRLAHTPVEAAPEAAPEAPEAATESDPVTPASTEAAGWVCTGCQTENSGKFCTECGLARPVETAQAKCANCGYEPAEDSSPKFCPECGTAFAQ